MKIVTSILVAILYFLLTLYITTLAVEAFNNSNRFFITQINEVPQSFQVTFLVSTVLLSIIAIITASLFTAYTHKTSHYITKYLKARRDNQIKNRFNDKIYEQLHTDLNKTNELDKQRDIIDNFFSINQDSVKDITRKNSNDLINKLIASMGRVPNSPHNS